jgi:hypothetical protein
MTAVLFGALGLLGGFLYASFFEWVLHRYLQHSVRFMRYPYRAHQLEHHAIFSADASYFLSAGGHQEGDKQHLTFAWWNAPLLIGLHAPLLAVLWWVSSVWVVVGVLVAMAGYYALYEYLHYCMHVPRGRRVEASAVFRFLQAHHRLHHVYYFRNLNVVLPLADLVLGTRQGPVEGLFEKIEGVRLKREARQEEEREEQVR